MNPKQPSDGDDSGDDVARLIATLRETERRLQKYVAGDEEGLSAPDTRTLLLRRAQDRLRDSEAARQAGILNALPAHIALLDGDGFIISVNDAWRNFASANGFAGSRWIQL